jgi:hypothetical protein
MSPVQRGVYALCLAEAHGVQVDVCPQGVLPVYTGVPDVELCDLFTDHDEAIRGALPFVLLEKLNQHQSRVAWSRSLQ